ncbi:succinate dehydrogenase, cytochrome b556 subunit [Thauera sp.]|jgi:succinate dehydrogenase / fumarate reductase cytochrome b subunit|uniref:succinate dehydrogenase, cytochrome b556 subunit n=1 Tax=Thauera sp. TaxID=1905334 RepID=UPI0039B7741D
MRGSGTPGKPFLLEVIMRSPTGGAPKFLNLFHIRFPIGAIASIGHRISGVLLLISLPLLALALERSLASEAAFESLRTAVATPWWGLLLLVVVWAAAQHVLAGVRHLLMDIGIGSPLAQARTSAWAVLLTAAIIALAAAIGWLT